MTFNTKQIIAGAVVAEAVAGLRLQATADPMLAEEHGEQQFDAVLMQKLRKPNQRKEKRKKELQNMKYQAREQRRNLRYHLKVLELEPSFSKIRSSGQFNALSDAEINKIVEEVKEDLKQFAAAYAKWPVEENASRTQDAFRTYLERTHNPLLMQGPNGPKTSVETFWHVMEKQRKKERANMRLDIRQIDAESHGQPSKVAKQLLKTIDTKELKRKQEEKEAKKLKKLEAQEAQAKLAEDQKRKEQEDKQKAEAKKAAEEKLAQLTKFEKETKDNLSTHKLRVTLREITAEQYQSLLGVSKGDQKRKAQEEKEKAEAKEAAEKKLAELKQIVAKFEEQKDLPDYWHKWKLEKKYLHAIIKNWLATKTDKTFATFWAKNSKEIESYGFHETETNEKFEKELEKLEELEELEEFGDFGENQKDHKKTE